MLNIANIRKEWFIEQLEILKRKGIPYTEIAASMGIKPQYLNLIKNTERGASENLTMKLCKTFNINYNDLLESIRNYEKQTTGIPEINEPSTKISSQRRIPLQDNNPNAGSMENEWIDTGELFPKATSAIRHYGDSMEEYPSGAILILKRIINPELIIWGRNYYVETKEIAVTKRLQDGGKNYIIGYSSNLKTYPDGRLVHEPVKIPKKNILQIHLILGCVSKEFGEGVTPTSIHTV
ncbi:helix-turn-helix transcriptional regulator [Proteiniphilum sp.]|uniref:helix-turn-helix transcriptional regulator n=1 Tax=Proteiniphilum sp. TaxID=1926877 RepID=UPI003327BBF7